MTIDDQLTVLRNQRAVQFRTITRKYNETTAILDGPADIATGRQNDLQTKMVVTKNALDGASIYTDEMVELLLSNNLGDARVDAEVTKQEEYTEKYLLMEMRIQQLAQPASAAAENQTAPSRRSKLPKMQLPRFDGDPLKWTEFHQIFKALVVDDQQLSTIEKMTYLLAQLDGEAKECLLSYRKDGRNFEAAYKYLEYTYGSSDVAKNARITALQNLKLKGGTLKHVRSFLNQAKGHLESLVAMGMSQEAFGPFMVVALMQQLPETYCRKVYEAFERESPDEDNLPLKSFIRILEGQIRLEEKVSSFTTVMGEMQLKSQTRQKEREEKVSMAAAAETAKDSFPPFPEKWEGRARARFCVYCRESAHPSLKCSKVATIEDRMKSLKDAGRCSICFRTTHATNDCDGYSCVCGGRHNISICPDKVPHKAAPPSSFVNPTGSTGTKVRSSKPLIKSRAAFIAAVEDGIQEDPSSDEDSPPSAEEEPPPSCVQRGTTTTAPSSRFSEAAVLMLVEGSLKCHQSTSASSASVILDLGSDVSYITSRERKALGLRPASTESRTLNVGTFGSSDRITVHTLQYVLSIRTKFGDWINITVLEVPTICSSISQPPIGEFSGLMGAKPVNLIGDAITPSVLIGSDHYWKFVSGELTRISDGLVLLDTSFGSMLSGSSSSGPPEESTTSLLSASCSFSPDDFWSLEHLGILDISDDAGSYEELRKLISFDRTENRFMAPLLWNDTKKPTQSNLRQAKHRLQSVLARMSADDLQAYDGVLRGWERDGIIASVSERVWKSEGAFYLPHHPVYQPGRSTSIRPVFDGSCKPCKDGQSLNDCLLKGENLLPHVLRVLINFRVKPLVLIGDITKAFLQIKLRGEDTDYCRFLWIDDPRGSPQKVVVKKFLRVPFGLSCSSVLLNGSLRLLFDQAIEEMPTKALPLSCLRDSFYVDDLCCTAFEPDLLLEMFRLVSQVTDAANLPLAKFATNCNLLKEKGGVAFLKDPITKVLGLLWDMQNDAIIFSFDHLASEFETMRKTRRNLLSIISKFFDPCGLSGPVTITGKILLQKLVKLRLNWDEEVPDVREFAVWFKNIRNLAFPRLVSSPAPGSAIGGCMLYLFCDASQEAYCCAIYLQFENGEVSLLCSKSRVAPLKELGMPRLELLACLIGSRCLENARAYVERSGINVIRALCFTDSTVALTWIVRVEEWYLWVRHRVEEIRRRTNGCDWNYCPSNENPADCATRSQLGIQKVPEIWCKGPSFLLSGAIPVQPEIVLTEQSLAEMRKSSRETLTVGSLLTTADMNSTGENIFETAYGRISSSVTTSAYQKLLASIAYVKRWLRDGRKVVGGFPTALEFKEAEVCVLRFDQKKHFGGLLKDLAEGKCSHDLNPFFDEDGLVRIKGRSQPNELILLHPSSRLTRLIVEHYHKLVGHLAVNPTLAQLREKFWVAKGRATVKSSLRSCVFCRRFSSPSFRMPASCSLPSFRTAAGSAFQYVGMDVLGPYQTRNFAEETEVEIVHFVDDVWVLLFTCAVSRAIHLELLTSLDTEHFILAFRRFISRRGTPSLIQSDNAKTFVKVSKGLNEMSRAFDEILADEETKRFLAFQRITHRLIPERSPHWGGYWERLVGIVKRVLAKTLGRRRLSNCQMETFLCNAEAIVNSRPLTSVDCSEGDRFEILTPALLVMGKNILSEGDPDFLSKFAKLPKLTLADCFRYQEDLRDFLWKKFVKEYLLSLLERQRNWKRKGTDVSPKLGQVVLLKDFDQPRLFWRLGRITQLFESASDGEIRSVQLDAVQKDNEKIFPTRRSLDRIVPLEIDHEEVVALES